MGQTGSDIQLSEAASKLIPYDFECKSHARYAVYADFEQAKSHGPRPILVIKQDRSEPLVIMTLEEFCTLIHPK